jgi:UDP-N-acetylmuramoyl-tripeptide--D-alanyl-D-alanine ligase
MAAPSERGTIGRVEELSLADVLSATGGELRGEMASTATFAGVELDVGKVRANDLFVAVPGERIDGHDLVPLAALHGARAALVAHRWAQGVRELALPLVVVGEPLVALQQIAAARRERLPATVVGVTGSVGKSSTKEVIAAVLSQQFTTYRSPGNRNNEIGLPLSILEIAAEAEVAVLEMAGAYAPGELELLAGIARPAIGVVTNVRPVHLERMRSIEAVAETKAELVEALPADGIAVLNGDDPLVRSMSSRCRGRVLYFGRTTGNDVRARDVTLLGLDGCAFWAEIAGSGRYFQVPLLGEHAVELVLAGLAVGHILGMTLAAMAPAFDDPAIQPWPRRVAGINGSLLLDDTYNATTTSVMSGLSLLESSAAGRRIAVLGDMLELGSLSEQEHRIVGRRAADAADLVLAFGELAMWIADEADRSPGGQATVVRFSPDRRQDLVDYLAGALRSEDVVLLKGSRGLRMEEVVEALRDPCAGSSG